MNGIMKWFDSKSKLKRWMLIILIGIALVCYGTAEILVLKEMSFGELAKIIVTFVIGIKTLFNKKNSNKIEQEEIIEDSQIEQNQENLEDEATKSEIQESLKDETNNDINESQNEGIKEEIGIPEQPNTEQINYYGVGILSISSIFLIITITFLSFFVKYQLKRNKKTSK